jgi:hypothetical protein
MEGIMSKRIRRFGLPALAAVLVLAAAPLFLARPAYAHCDTMDGPVVKAAQRALETKELTPLLIWVREQDEAEIRHSFEHTLEVRALGGKARELADRYFFETVVRIHREGEGEPYTGLKPAGTDIGHTVPAADRALQSGSSAELRALLVAALDARLDEYFAQVMAKRDFAPNDVRAGREYVEAYVQFVHLAEELEAILSGHGHGHADADAAGHGAAAAPAPKAAHGH